MLCLSDRVFDFKAGKCWRVEGQYKPSQKSLQKARKAEIPKRRATPWNLSRSELERPEWPKFRLLRWLLNCSQNQPVGIAVPSSPIQDAAGRVLADAAPLFEEEGDVGGFALVADAFNPCWVHGARFGA